MELECPGFIDDGKIKPVYTCDGDNVSPEVNWSGAPEGTKSFCLLMHDPDAPSKDWVHWLIINIPSSINSIPKGGPAPGNELINDFGRTSYGGPCPPSGIHRYFIELYALSVPDLANINKNNFLERINPYILAKAELVGNYERKNN